ncbi:hypothetical protein BWQ96_03077 [Gracilariopsis chorda]|uniref:Uncharacterized protein n=1 Tax=Gracilariopsis chorda TaxID=448386 RepID=A0A2V3IYJ0_9FLOR|nr:hypothetical protein BWQ96_03077 [Gracilariopsis chorda]|eukprot:PXF47135.1 hypothetical protein BWQ96_03077 [Gracilariopsis chorda]
MPSKKITTKNKSARDKSVHTSGKNKHLTRPGGSKRSAQKTISKSRKSKSTHRSPAHTSSRSRTAKAPKPSRSRRTARHPSSSLGPGPADPVTIIILIILGISAIVLFALGVWLLASQNGWPLGLNNTGNTNWTRTISYGTACVVLSLLFIPIIIFVVLDAAAKRGSQARVTRLVVLFLCAFCILILLLMSVTGVMFAANRPGFIASIIEDAWTKTVLGSNTVKDACDIQSKYDCRGWKTNSCLNCNPTRNGVYANCQEFQKLVCPRCAPPIPIAVPATTQPQQPTTTAPVTVPTNPSSGDATIEGVQPNQDQLVQRMLSRMAKRVSSLRNVARQTGTQTIQRVRGCRYYVLRRYRRFFIPMTVYTIFLLLLLLVLSYKGCVDSAGRC